MNFGGLYNDLFLRLEKEETLFVSSPEKNFSNSVQSGKSDGGSNSWEAFPKTGIMPPWEGRFPDTEAGMLKAPTAVKRLGFTRRLSHLQEEHECACWVPEEKSPGLLRGNGQECVFPMALLGKSIK